MEELLKTAKDMANDLIGGVDKMFGTDKKQIAKGVLDLVFTDYEKELTQAYDTITELQEELNDIDGMNDKLQEEIKQLKTKKKK